MIIIAQRDEVYADHGWAPDFFGPKKSSDRLRARGSGGGISQSAFKAHFVGSCKFALHT